MKTAEFYEKINGNYREVLERLLNKEELVQRFLKKYLTDSSFQRLEEAVESGDVEAIFRAAHTLKGVVSNLGLTPLYDATHVLVEITRSGRSDGIAETFERIAAAHHDITELIHTVN